MNSEDLTSARNTNLGGDFSKKILNISDKEIDLKKLLAQTLHPHPEEHHPEVRQDPAQTPPAHSHSGVILTAQTLP